MFYACGRCGYKFSSKAKLLIHLNKNIPCDYVCNQCGYNFSCKASFSRHHSNGTECNPKKYSNDEYERRFKKIKRVEKDVEPDIDEESNSSKLSNTLLNVNVLTNSENNKDSELMNILLKNPHKTKDFILDILRTDTSDEKYKKILSDILVMLDKSNTESKENDNNAEDIPETSDPDEIDMRDQKSVVLSNTIPTPNTNADEYVYLLWKREFKRLNEPTYKIGRTSNPILTRMNGYDKSSELLLSASVKNSLFIENKIKELFKHKYKQMTEYGTEYFYGNYKDMLQDIELIVKLYNYT